MSSFLYNDSELQMDTNVILCIEEHDNPADKSSIDTRLFVGWDWENGDYFIRGKRQDTINSNYVPYAFHCDSTRDLCNFIGFTLGKNTFKSLTLYNFNNLEGFESESDMTYEFFEEHMDPLYEMAGYDYIKISNRQLMSYLRILQNTYNWK